MFLERHNPRLLHKKQQVFPPWLHFQLAFSLNSGKDVSKGQVQEIPALLQLLFSTRWLCMLLLLRPKVIFQQLFWLFFSVCPFDSLFLYFAFLFWGVGVWGFFFSFFGGQGGMGTLLFLGNRNTSTYFCHLNTFLHYSMMNLFS